MERLKTRQRLEKLNTLGSPAPLANNEINYDAPEDDNSSHLASKIRVNSIINQSIPEMSYAPKKFKTQVTAKEIEEYQRKENTPIEINGQFYRIHPASIPEPELEEVTTEAEIKTAIQLRNENASKVNGLLVTLRQYEKKLDDVNDALVRLDEEFDQVMSKPPPPNVNLLSTYLSVAELAGFANTNDQQRRQNEEQYAETKQGLLDEREGIIVRLDELVALIEQARAFEERFDEEFPAEMAKAQGVRDRNKAKIKEFEDNLKSVNRTFNITQDPNETDEEYIIRIRDQTSAIEDPNLVKDRFDLDQAREFKRNLKEIIRDNSVIEVAYNALNQENGGANRNIPDINKVFQLIKTRYEKIYGTFQLSDVDLIHFLKQIIEDPELTARRAQEEEEALLAVASQTSSRTVPLPAGMTDDLNEKYKVVAKASNFTNGELVLEIKRLKDFFTADIEVIDKDGNPVVVSKGEGGGINVTYKGKKANVSVASKSTLVPVYVGLLEHIKRTAPTQYATLNQQVNQKTQDAYGEGMGIPHEPLPKSCKLGKIDIDLNKLFYKNILSVKHNGFKINGVKNVPVGDEFVKIIMDLCKGQYPITKELNKLGAGESQIYDALLHTAGLHKRVEHTANKSVEKLKQRLTLIEGELTAGNTNKQLYQELRDIVFKLHHLGEITQNSANEYLKQMK